VMRVQPAVIGMAAFIRLSDVQFGHCRFHTTTLTASWHSG
jgi:hypothetical protein